MALPFVVRPEYTTTIPSSGKKVKYQPFTVREEKILILAAESQDPDEITNAVTKCLKGCVVSPADFDVNKIALFDVEYLFLKCRAKSVGEKLLLKVTDPDDETYTVDHEINVDRIGIIKDKKHKDLIDIGGDIQVKMRYPDITFFTDGIDMSGIDSSIQLISRCLQSIVHDEEVYNKADMTDGELEEWLEGLSNDQFSKIMEFFRTMPKLSHTIKLKNPNTGLDFEIVLEGLSDFF